MTVKQKEIIRRVLHKEEFPHWLFDHSVVESDGEKVYALQDWVVFIVDGLPSVASREEVKSFITRQVFRDLRRTKS